MVMFIMVIVLLIKIKLSMSLRTMVTMCLSAAVQVMAGDRAAVVGSREWRAFMVEQPGLCEDFVRML